MRPTDRPRGCPLPPSSIRPTHNRPSDFFTDHDRSNVSRAFFIDARKTQSAPRSRTRVPCVLSSLTRALPFARSTSRGVARAPVRLELGRDRVDLNSRTRSRAAYLSVRRDDMQVRERMIGPSVHRSIDRSGIGGGRAGEVTTAREEVVDDGERDVERIDAAAER